MRVLSVSMLVFTSLVTICGLGLGAGRAAAQTVPVAATVPARKTVALEISNKAGLVTVREKDGAFLFAQALPPDEVHIHVDPLGKDALGKTRDYRLTIRDVADKLLWETKLGDGKPSSLRFEYSMGENDAGVSISMTPYTSPLIPSEDKTDTTTTRIILQKDNRMSRGEMLGEDGGGFRAETNGDSAVMFERKDGKWTEKTRASLDQANGKAVIVQGGKVTSATWGEHLATLKDKVGTVTFRPEVRDGKKYMALDFGNRRVLLEIESDLYSWGVGGDGAIIISKNAP